MLDQARMAVDKNLGIKAGREFSFGSHQRADRRADFAMVRIICLPSNEGKFPASRISRQSTQERIKVEESLLRNSKPKKREEFTRFC